jgi:hypothetical protein
MFAFWVIFWHFMTNLLRDEAAEDEKYIEIWEFSPGPLLAI